MPTTTLGLTYPALTDGPNGPVQIQQLAEDTDDLFTSHTFQKAFYKAVRGSGTPISLTDATATPVVTYPGTAEVVGTGITFGSGLLTVGAAGVYRWDVSLDILGSSASPMPAVTALVKKNGSTLLNDGKQRLNLASTRTQSMSGGGPVTLAAADTLQLVLQLDGDTIANAATVWFFSLLRVA